MAAVQEASATTATAAVAAAVPFWLANLTTAWVALVCPSSHPDTDVAHVPPLHEFRIRSRIFRRHGQLRVENARQAIGREAAARLDDRGKVATRWRRCRSRRADAARTSTWCGGACRARAPVEAERVVA
jgi:hypothetical protein